MKRLQLVDVRHARGFIGKEPEPNQFLETAKHQSGHLVQIVLGMILQTPKLGALVLHDDRLHTSKVIAGEPRRRAAR